MGNLIFREKLEKGPEAHAGQFLSFLLAVAIGRAEIASPFDFFPFVGSVSPKRQSVEPLCAFVFEKIVNSSLAIDSGQTIELRADHDQTEMSLRALGNIVPMAFIFELKPKWLETLCDFCAYGSLDRHRGFCHRKLAVLQALFQLLNQALSFHSVSQNTNRGFFKKRTLNNLLFNFLGFHKTRLSGPLSERMINR